MAASFIKKKINKLKSRLWFSIYYGRYQKSKINNKMVFLESRNGSDMAGNILYIAKELSENPDYKHLKLCFTAKPFMEEKVKLLLQQYNIRKYKFLREESLRYYKYLSKSKYLVNDTSFPRRFIKKEGQIILNTWHGTPLKNMGRDVVNEVYNMGNVMRNLVFSDYLVFPNEYMKEKMTSAYMLQNLCKATILNEGYPRNSVFFDKERRKKLRNEFGIDNKQVLVYMPTWRGQVNKYDQEGVTNDVTAFLKEMDSKLQDNQLMYVKYHPLMALELSDEEYKHIKAFPTGHEYYEILNMADTLITDYSSVFYDFANSGQKIILYCYDKEEYFANRGVYVSLDDFPFPQVETIDELIKEINKPKNYDDTEFIKQYCTYDSPDAVKRICQRVFLDKKVTNEEHYVPNGKKNVLMFAGDLAKNGITTAFLSVLDNIDLSKNNYYVAFREALLRKDPMRTSVLPKEVGIIPVSSEITFDFKADFGHRNFMVKGKEKDRYKNIMAEVYKREIKKHFYGLKFDHVIHYAGYENMVLGMLTQFDAKKTVYVHNDMIQEIETRHNQNEYLLRWVYSTCDHVLPVSNDIFEPTYQISRRKDNIMVMNNFHNHEAVVAKSKMPIEFQSDTETYCPYPDGVNHILNSKGLKFITIGRFSPEKGHFRLIDAFEEFHKTHPDSSLIIIGGHGVLYNKTIQHIRETNCWKNIILIKSIQNPMPILKLCDLFIISSFYEGLPMVLHEADSLGVPAFSTDIHGPSGYFKEFGFENCLVEDSTEGILKGMNDFVEGKIKPLNIDYAKRNQGIREKLEKILD